MAEHVPIGSNAVVGRYALHTQIAAGGMATIHLGHLVGPAGFGRIVAIKRLHGTFTNDPNFIAMFLDEARLAARIRHPNVVSIIDVVAEHDELMLVMEYVHGESFAGLLAMAAARGNRADPPVVVKVMTDVLSGLHAAHELKSEDGLPLSVVHRDISPQNILVAADGVAHVIDFGIAKAVGRAQHTKEGQLKGKLRYMAPEQINVGHAVDRRTDVFAAAVVLWEALVGRNLFLGTEGQLLHAVLTEPIPPPRSIVPDLPKALQAVVMKGLERKPAKRFASALEMADALEAAMRPATSRSVARWMQGLAAETLEQRARLIAAIERQEYASGRVAVHRESGPLPHGLADVAESSAFSSIGDFDDLPGCEPGDVGRRTMPLVTTEPPIAQMMSAVHSRISDRALQPRRHTWRWFVAGIATLAIAVLILVGYTRWRASNASKPSASARPELRPALVPPTDPATQLATPHSTTNAAPQAGPESSGAIAEIAEPGESSSNVAHKGASIARQRAAKSPRPGASVTTPSDPPPEVKSHPLYIRD